MSKIGLLDVLKLEDTDNVKVRFNSKFEDKKFDGNRNPIELFKNREEGSLLNGIIGRKYLKLGK